MRLAPLLAVVALLASVPAFADISLPGSQHIGDDNCSSIAFVPCDPVSRALMKSNPTHFNLSSSATVSAVQLVSPIDLNDKLQVFIDDMNTALAGTKSGSCDNGGTCTYTLTTPIALSSGSHTIWPDGGCTSGTTFAAACSSGAENDFSFSSINLVSTATNTSRSINRRYHLGDYAGEGDYYGGTYYPDSPDGTFVSMTFTVDATRLLSQIQFWRARDVNAANPVLLDANPIPIGTLSTNGSPVILSTSEVVATGTHTLTVQSKIVSGSNYDDFSWDDIVMILVNNPATTPGAFNAVDPGGAAASGTISTKTAGSAATVELVAVSGGSQLATYTGTVSVDLLDSSNTTGVAVGGTNCDAGWTLITSLPGATFAAVNAGRVSYSFIHDEARQNVRLRITDSALGVTGCSTDNFAIKPDHFAVTVTHGSATTAGTTQALNTGASFDQNSSPIHHAGAPFTITATAYNAVGTAMTYYAGSPTLQVVGSLLGSTAGSLTISGSWSATGSTGEVRLNSVSYSEAGAVQLQITDTTFAQIDAADTPANFAVTPLSFNVGRFTPDHFVLASTTTAAFTPGCAAATGMTYVGQPFSFTATPVATLTAVAAGGATTVNYDGALYRLPSGNAPQATWSVGTWLTNATTTTAGGVFDTTGFPSPDNSLVNNGNGVSTYTVIPRTGGYQFTRASPSTPPLRPFYAEIALRINLGELDGVDLDSTQTQGWGATTYQQGISFGTAGANQFRFGRLVIDNAHGSEKLPLPVPIRAEYWNVAGEGFARNLLDSCTTLIAASITVTPQRAGTTALSLPGTLVSGLLTPLLSPPSDGAAEQVQLTGQITGTLPWLRIDFDGNGAYDDEPRASATFGVFKNDERRIFQREVISP